MDRDDPAIRRDGGSAPETRQAPIGTGGPGSNVIARAWRWLTEPPGRLPMAERRRGQALSAILIALIGLGVVGEAAYLWATRGNDPAFAETAATLTALALAYVLCRVGHVKSAAALTVLLITLGIFVLVLEAQDGAPDLLLFLPIALLIANVFFPSRIILVLCALQTAGVLSLPALGVEADPVALVTGPVFFLWTAAVITLISNRLRDQAETDRRAELARSEKRFRSLVEHSLEEVSLVAPDGTLIFESESVRRPLGYRQGQFLGHPLFELLHPDDKAAAQELLEQIVRLPGVSREAAFRLRHQNGSWRWMEGTATNLLQEPAVGAVVINYRDVTERRRAEDNLLRQFGQLRALGEIDRAISSTFGMKVSLNTLLTHLTAQLQVDAATVWLVDSSLNRLEFAAARGFRSNEFLHAGTLQVGEGYAGRAALERRPISVPHLMSQTDNPRLIRALQAENFVSYLAMPLLAKGTVRGVLEIFQRAGLDPEPEWLEFLNTLAGQAAIAIENATLFEGMQRANSELTLAYDKTIEGWSAALDLRDKETEGHTQRVTELTLTLAEAFGVNKADLVHVRRGGLLHDIGKMGVPDRILLKPGPLSPDEWEIMRKHPTLAHELLAPISYLERALAIPYCHHEKWDGSGYPRGLKGEQIPLAARLFAVVDVWDALLSDRPYRRAWAREDALEHIRSGSGRHFDPAAVEAFLPLVTQG